MTTIYVNGKKTPKEKLKYIKLQQEGIKRILEEKLYIKRKVRS